MVGDTGFEPVNVGFKIRCLRPAWLIPNMNANFIKSEKQKTRLFMVGFVFGESTIYFYTQTLFTFGASISQFGRYDDCHV
jgi:hypothetical protein